MKFKDLNDFFSQVRDKNVPTLEQWNYLEELTDNFKSNKLELLLSDLKEYRKLEKGKLLQQYRLAKKTETYMEIVKKGDSVPYIDFYETFLERGWEKKLPKDLVSIEGEKYLSLFFPNELSPIDQLISHLEKIKPQEEDIKSTPPNLPSKLKWEGEHIEFAELIKSLIEAKKITGTSEKAIFEDFCSIMNIKEFKKDKRISGLKKRKIDTTPLLLELEASLNKWLDQ